MAKLILRHVTKTYAKRNIIDRINLTVNDGEFLALVGPSGCGKSTLLRLIAGLETLSEGDIYIGDKKVNRLPAKNRDIAMVFQNYALYPHMTVAANIGYGLKMRGFDKALIADRVSEVAQILELTDLLERKPADLSGGQRQRVAMGRAIARQAKIFLFDEPLSNLDAKLRVHMRMEIKKLQSQFKTTSVYVTHDQVEAMTMADRIAVIHQGKIEQVGTPMEIYLQPATQFVASFIGSPTMNFIQARTGSENDVILNDSLRFSVNSTQQLPSQITCGIRPEHFYVNHEVTANCLSLQVQMIEALGSDTMVYGVLAGCDESVCIRLAANMAVKEGDRLPLSVDPQHIHVFNSETQKRVDLNER